MHPQIRIKNGISEQLSALREAEKLQAFHLERSRAMMKNISELKKTILWQDKLIMQLEKELVDKYKEIREMSSIIRCQGEGSRLCGETKRESLSRVHRAAAFGLCELCREEIDLLNLR